MKVWSFLQCSDITDIADTKSLSWGKIGFKSCWWSCFISSYVPRLAISYSHKNRKQLEFFSTFFHRWEVEPVPIKLLYSCRELGSHWAMISHWTLTSPDPAGSPSSLLQDTDSTASTHMHSSCSYIFLFHLWPWRFLCYAWSHLRDFGFPFHTSCIIMMGLSQKIEHQSITIYNILTGSNYQDHWIWLHVVVQFLWSSGRPTLRVNLLQFEARSRSLKVGALGQPKGMEWGGRREVVSGWGGDSCRCMAKITIIL